MELRQLRIERLRLIERLDLQLAPHWNLLTGPNGAGKTSILEAAFLLSHARSFRTASRDALVQHGSSGYLVSGRVVERERGFQAGLARERGRFQARLEGDSVPAAELLRRVAVTCFEPGSHELISGGAEGRRRFLDWGVFHVEPDFLSQWRRCQRALRQRNVLLRLGAPTEELVPWERELAAAAHPVSAARRRYMDALGPHLQSLMTELLVELEAFELHFDEGHEPGLGLETTLEERRERDRQRGHTSAGPHRADWSLRFGPNRREHLSRGQEKLCAFACIMAQVRLFQAQQGEWPILCLDDPASELDPEHQDRLLDVVDASGAQVLATATSEPARLRRASRAVTRFHVEQGGVTALL